MVVGYSPGLRRSKYFEKNENVKEPKRLNCIVTLIYRYVINGQKSNSNSTKRNALLVTVRYEKTFCSVRCMLRTIRRGRSHCTV